MWGEKGEYLADISYLCIRQPKTKTNKNHYTDECIWKINADVMTWTLRETVDKEGRIIGLEYSVLTGFNAAYEIK